MQRGRCNQCGELAQKKCAACNSVYYCTKQCQKTDWKSHKGFCKLAKKQMQVQKTEQFKVKEQQKSQSKLKRKSNKFDKVVQLPGPSNPLLNQQLKAGESVGTFRWKTLQKLQKLPKFHPYMLKNYTTDWQQFISVRLSQFTQGGTLTVQPITIDALSFPMTIVNCIKQIEKDLSGQKLKIVIMGATAKAEQRIYMQNKNYFQEIANYFGGTQFYLHFVGPEISSSYHLKSFNTTTTTSQSKVAAEFFKGTVGEFLLQCSMQTGYQYELNKNDTIFIGFNPGFGCGYEKLAWNWVQDIQKLLKKEFYVIFTQANDFEDVKGESKILREVLQAQFIVEPVDNPFRAISHLHEPGCKETKWMCANSFFYIIKGFEKDAPHEIDNKCLRGRLMEVIKGLKS